MVAQEEVAMYRVHPHRGTPGRVGSHSSAGGESSKARTTLAIIGVALLAGAVLSARWWQQQPLRTLEFTGVELLDTAQLHHLLQQGADALPEQPSLAEWRERLLRHPLIAEATLSWRAPGTLRVHVRERRLVALVVTASGQYALDSSGALFELPSAPQGQLPIVAVPKLQEWMKGEAAAIACALRKELLQVERLHWAPQHGWVARMENGWEVLLGDTTALEAKCSRARRFLRWRGQAAPQRVDVRWSGQVVVSVPVPQPQG
jgi:cell division septal protein FtsQ